MKQRTTPRLPGRKGRRRGCNAGIAALEFAFVAPIFLLLLAAVVDLGDELYLKMRLEAAVDAGANYALIHASSVTTTPASLATTVANIVATSNSGMTQNTTVVVNNGPSASVTNGAATSANSTASTALWYCPTGSGPNWDWGSSVSQGSACTGGGSAGQFVSITASYAYSPIVPGFSFATAGTLSINAMVQTN